MTLRLSLELDTANLYMFLPPKSHTLMSVIPSHRLTDNSSQLIVNHTGSLISKYEGGIFKTNYYNILTFNIADIHKILCIYSILPVSSNQLLFMVGEGRRLSYSVWLRWRVSNLPNSLPSTVLYGILCRILCSEITFITKIQCAQYQFYSFRE